ncbi:hypothetical protein [Priestia megaterium]|uniref:hypothetical protein n=1 Tax=Priestia megaterium TaxID=1404 RepID=UPI00196A3FE8|nr:hypothetical protein [Priestia megaterium]QSF37550.1 hypothetical protein ICR96_19090 [Priestia megaterium]
MIGEQDEDSCGESGIGETLQERLRRGGSPAARGKRSLARKSTAVHFVMSQPCFTYLSSTLKTKQT